MTHANASETHMQKGGNAMLRTDGRTYERITHPDEIPQLPERAGNLECPSTHPHQENCYRKHRCRCETCRKNHADMQREYLNRNPEKRRRKCECGCGVMVLGHFANGHNPRNPTLRINPAGMTRERAFEIAMGATPRERIIQ